MNELVQFLEDVQEEQLAKAETKKRKSKKENDLDNDKAKNVDESEKAENLEEDLTSTDDRDPGVSDDDWSELELSKIKDQNEHQIRIKIMEKEIK